MSAPTPESRVAYHEAGHAVMAEHHGMDVGRATIVAGGPALGSVLRSLHLHDTEEAYDDELARKRAYGSDQADACEDEDTGSRPPSFRDRVESTVQASLAGTLAERLHNPDLWDVDGAEGDFENVYGPLDILCGCDVERRAYVILLGIQAENRLLMLWPQVEAVAEALLEHQTLDGEAVRQAMKDAPMTPKVRPAECGHAYDIGGPLYALAVKEDDEHSD